VISATTPNQLAAMMLAHPRSFDFTATFSSLEHSGLGRYGDSLNPYRESAVILRQFFRSFSGSGKKRRVPITVLLNLTDQC